MSDWGAICSDRILFRAFASFLFSTVMTFLMTGIFICLLFATPTKELVRVLSIYIQFQAHRARRRDYAEWKRSQPLHSCQFLDLLLYMNTQRSYPGDCSQIKAVVRLTMLIL